ncbi:MAG: dihydroneopterin aldolase [Deltaproteobacteria bacterium]|nr:dihydroneopterin aldolase [Deltaproteobacteria bacterium]
MSTKTSTPPPLSASSPTPPEGVRTEAGVIGLEGLTFDGHHGYYRGERTRARPFGVDLQVGRRVDRAAHSDELEDTLDYNGLAETAGRIVTETSFRLIERLAGAIADALLEEHPTLRWVEVTVHKPSPQVVGNPRAAWVRLRRDRIDVLATEGHPGLE